MKQYKMLFVGLITGAVLATAGTSFADSAIEEVKAYLRPDFKVQVDGKEAELANTPLIYEGSSYLPVREIADLVGKEVDFQNGVIMLNAKASVVNSADWITLSDYATMNNLKIQQVPGSNSVFSAVLGDVTVFTFQGSEATTTSSFTATTPKGEHIRMATDAGSTLINVTDLNKLNILHIQ